jgi:hypothetical protein
MPNYFKPIEFKRLDNGEIVAESACLIVEGRTIVGQIGTVSSLDMFSSDTRKQVALALELTGGSEATLSEYIFVYGVTFDSVSPNSVTEMAGLLVRKRDISAITIGAYGVFSGEWTREEVEALSAQKEEYDKEIRQIVKDLRKSGEL